MKLLIKCLKFDRFCQILYFFAYFTLFFDVLYLGHALFLCILYINMTIFIPYNLIYGSTIILTIIMGQNSRFDLFFGLVSFIEVTRIVGQMGDVDHWIQHKILSRMVYICCLLGFVPGLALH